MTRKAWIAAALVLGALFLLGRLNEGAEQRESWLEPVDAAQTAATEEEALALLEVHAAPSGTVDEPVPQPSPPTRTAVEVPVPEPLVQVPDPEPLHGVLLDAWGQPLADQPLTYTLQPTDSLQFARDSHRSFRKAAPSRGFVGQERAVTNEYGEFHFIGPNRRDGGRLTFGVPGYVEGWVAAPVDPDADWQTLQALPTPHQDSTWTFWIHRSTRLEPVAIERVTVEHLSGSFDFPRRLPLASERTIEMTDQATKVVQAGLAPGKWRFTFVATHGLHQRVEIEVEKPGRTQTLGVIVESWPGAEASELVFTADPDGGAPWVDGSSGLGDWLPAERLRIGEERRDRHFAETLRVGHGPLKAAELTLRLRSISSMSTNDAIYLEHTGSKRFAWKSRISALTGSWSRGMSRTLHLDLARLPGQGEERVDIRSHLEDGLLDVVIQDDTVIESMSIRVVR